MDFSVNFTREPIIETIISPKDGYKLCVKSSRGASTEDYFVDAIEVVSFGRAFFFRSLERPKAFLVPVTDYEVIEVKETRVALKNTVHERSIKIGGGREAAVRVNKEVIVDKSEDLDTSSLDLAQDMPEESSAEVTADSRGDNKKRDRRRHRRRRLAEERREWIEKEKQEQSPAPASNDVQSPSKEGGGNEDEAVKVSSSIFSTLFPPPSTLIADTIGRYKDKEGLEGVFFTKPVERRSETQETENATDLPETKGVHAPVSDSELSEEE